MKAIDLFAGLGGFTEGATQAGVEVLWAANHWRFAVEAHAANHPAVVHACQDLRQADWTALPRYDLLLAAPACVPADALIECGGGVRVRADEVTVGTKVLTHRGRKRTVKSVWRKRFTGNLVTISVWGATRMPVEVTEDHRVWIRRRRKNGGWLAPEFIQAGDVRPGDYVGFPRTGGRSDAGKQFVDRLVPGRTPYTAVRNGRTRQSSLPGASKVITQVGTDLWWLVGQYLGDGQLREDRPQIGWSIGGDTNRLNRIAKILSDLGLRSWRRGPSSNTTIFASSKHLHAICLAFGRLCHEKKLPRDVLEGFDGEEALALLTGYLESDGYRVRGRSTPTYKIGSTSLQLLQDVQRLCWRIGWSAGIAKGNAPGQAVIEGRTVTCRRMWVLNVVTKPHAQSRTKFGIDHLRVWRSVRSVSRKWVEREPVFDFEVAEDHTFCLPGVIVHNCQGHSTSSQPRRRAYHDAMRATAWAVVDCAEVTEPRALVVENVPAFRRWQLYDVWRLALERLGFTLAEHVVRASHHGVPQRRDRLFVVGLRGRRFSYAPRWIREPAFGPSLDPSADGWRPVSAASPGARVRFAKGRRNCGERFLSQHVTGHPGVPLHEPIRTITTKDQWCLVDGERYRPLTPRELARAQGFRDDYRWPEAPRNEVLRAIGNAVAPPVARDLVAAVSDAA